MQSSKDLEERDALASLKSTIERVKERVNDLEMERMFAETGEDEVLSFEQIKSRLRQVQLEATEVDQNLNDGNPVRSQKTFSVKSTKMETFSSIMCDFERMVAEGRTELEVIRENYHLCDFEFLQLLSEETQKSKDEGRTKEHSFFSNIKSAVDTVMVEEMKSAELKLAQILSNRDPKLMEIDAVRMVKLGEINDAVILLLEGNIASAKKQGADKAVHLLSRILVCLKKELERNLPAEQKLLRELLRVKSSQKRKELLYNAFKPNKVIIRHC